jgi:hypothetical protein
MKAVLPHDQGVNNTREATLPETRCNHPNMALTMSRGLRQETMFPSVRCYHLSQTLTTSLKLRSLIGWCYPMLLAPEEGSRYPIRALGTRVATYWLIDTKSRSTAQGLGTGGTTRWYSQHSNTYRGLRQPKG